MHPTRFLIALLTLLCWLPAPRAAAAPSIALTPAEQAWLTANPRILMGSDAQWRPYVWRRDDGTLAGIETDLIARINALTGANLQLVLGDWHDMVERARRGELHGLAASATHPERAERFLFSASAYSTHKYIFTRRSEPFARMEDLAGRRVGVLADNLSDIKLLRRWPAIEPVEIATPLALAVGLHNGDLDAAISSANLLWISDENLLPGLQIAFPVPGSRIALRYSIGKEQAPLLGIIDKAIAAMEPREVQAILKRWGEPRLAEIDISAEERAWLAQHHRVRVRIGEAPPWEINRPEPRGMAVDYLRIIGELFGIEFDFIAADEPWIDGFEDMAGAHRHYDLLPAAKRTDERRATLAMSEDYLASPWTIFSRKGGPDIDGLDALRHKTVAVERGYVMHDLLRTEAPAIRLSVQDHTKDALLALSTGNVDAYVGNLIVTDYLMQAYGITNLQMAGPTPFGVHAQAMVTRKAWAPLISLIDKGLKAIPAQRHIAIRQQWMTSVADAQTPAPLDLSDAQAAWLAAHPSIRVGAYPLAPYIREQSGQVDGYLVELLAAVAARAGLRTEVRFQPLDQVLEGIGDGSLDVALAINPTAERAREMILSEATTAFTLSLFARKEAHDIRGLPSLAGKTLATYRGHSWNARYPKLLAQTQILVADDMEAMFRMVAEGRADAAISETASGKLLLRRNLLTGVEPKAVAVFDGRRSRKGHYWGVSKRLPALAAILDAAYAALPEASKQRIWERWFARERGAGAVDLSPAERAYLDTTVFRRALASAWMPFDFADNGTPTGVAEDYWRLIRDKLGLRETIGERQPFGAILTAFARGDADLYAATTATADRQRYALFSDPYERYPIAIAGAAGAGLFAGSDALSGRRVAVGRDYSAHRLLQARFPEIAFVLVDDTRAALAAVAAGRAELAVDILPVLHQQIEQFPAGRVKLVGVTDVQFPLEIMVRREHARLLPLLNRAIAAITPEERAAIHHQWLLRDVVTAPDYRLLWQVLATALLILATVLYWNHRLHREVARRRQAEVELLRAKARADRASRAKGDFLANMSHELRTPLNAVIGLARLSLETRPAPALRAYLDKIDLSARTLLALISDVLDLARIEASKLQPRQAPLDLGAVLTRVRVMLEQQAAEKGLALRIEAPPQPLGALLGDDLRLTQVLLNLVGNAVKFTTHGAVTLHVSVEDENEDALRLGFAVVDTGIGIPPGCLADLFEAFTQVDNSTTRDHGGSGLGLTISARLVALMGGRLEVASTEGRGSRFWFSLDFPRQPQETAAAPTPAAPVDLRGVRVLVAEDDPVSRLVVHDLLRNRGARVSLVGNGAEAVAAVAEGGGFDLLLLDLRMPQMDGLSACRRIRTLPGGDLPIVALTANALAEERAGCLAAGMDGYLTKPLEPEALDAELAHRLRLPADTDADADADADTDTDTDADTDAAPAPPGASPTQSPPGFDAAKVQRWLDQDPDAWRGMVQVFVDHYASVPAAVADALDADDRAGAIDLLHRLRGAAGAIGAAALSAAAKRLERALASDSPVDPELRARFGASAQAALATLAGLAPPSGAVADTAPGDEERRLEALAALLEAGNTRALDHLPWLAHWVGTDAPAQASELQRQIEALDFPAALATLRGILARDGMGLTIG